MKHLKSSLATALVLSVGTGVAIPASASAQSADERVTIETSDQLDVELNTQTGGMPQVAAGASLVKIGFAIADAVANANNRQGFVLALVENAWYEFKLDYNVVVFKSGDDFSWDLKGVQLDATFDPINILPEYRIFVFETGDVTNDGDGGFINWAYRGQVTREDDGDRKKAVFN